MDRFGQNPSVHEEDLIWIIVIVVSSSSSDCTGIYCLVVYIPSSVPGQWWWGDMYYWLPLTQCSRSVDLPAAAPPHKLLSSSDSAPIQSQALTCARRPLACSPAACLLAWWTDRWWCSVVILRVSPRYYMHSYIHRFILYFRWFAMQIVGQLYGQP